MTTLNIQNLSISGDTAQKTVPRERLIGLLKNNIDKNLFLIYSPPGYGKTSLVKSFIERQRSDSVWLNVSPRINHIYSFFRYLVTSLRKVDKRFGKNTLEIIESRQEKNQLSKNIKLIVNEIVKTFISEFNTAFDKDVILVLDDLHNISDSKWAKEVFNVIFDNFPEKLHLVLITSQLPDFHFSKLIEKDAILKVGIEDLIFRFDEIVSLIDGIYSFDYTENEVKLLEKNLGGWITGIHLILQSFGKDFKNLKLDFQLIPENIFNILAKSIFDQLDERSKDFMLRSSLLENFDAKLCNHVLDIEDSHEIISNLISKNLITTADPGFNGNGHSLKFNYQVLLKKYLSSRMYSSYSIETIRYILVKAAEYYYNKKDMTGAINCFMLAGEYDSAVPIIIGNFKQLFNEGKFETLWNWLGTLENEQEISNPNIIYYLGVMYKFYIGDLDKSLYYLQRATDLLKKVNDKNNLVNAIITKAGVLLNSGKTKQVIEELSALADVQTSNETRANLFYHLAHAYYHNAEYDKTTSLLKESLELSNNGVSINKSSDIYNMFGHIELIKGNFINSVVYYERVLEGNPNLFNRFETLCNLVLLTSQNGKYAKSRKYLTQIDEMIKNFQTPVFQVPYLLAKQAYLYESADYKGNISVLNEIGKIADSMNHKVYKYLFSRLMSETYYYMKDAAKSKEYHEIAVQYLDNDNDLERIEMKVADAFLNMNGSFEKTLLEAYRYYESNDYLYSKVQIEYKLAGYYFDHNKLDEAKKYLEDCLNTASQNGYVSFFAREYALSKTLLDFAAENQIHSDFIKPILNFKED